MSRLGYLHQSNRETLVVDRSGSESESDSDSDSKERVWMRDVQG